MNVQNTPPPPQKKKEKKTNSAHFLQVVLHVCGNEMVYLMHVQYQYDEKNTFWVV